MGRRLATGTLAGPLLAVGFFVGWSHGHARDRILVMFVARPIHRPFDAFGTSLCQRIFRWLNVIFSRPNQPLFQRHAAAIPPTFLGRLAAAMMIHAGK
jgi:hypothetical protein